MSDGLGMTAVLTAEIEPFEAAMMQALNVAKNFATLFASVISEGVKDSFSRLYTQGRLADSLTSTVPAIREFEYALDKFGIGAQKAQASLAFFETGIGKALAGGKKQQEAFKSLGLDVIALGREEPIQALENFLEAVNKLPTAAQRLAVERDIFGQGSRKMLPLLAHLKEAREEFRNMTGYSVNGKNFEIGLIDYKRIEMAQEAIVKLTALWQNFMDRILIRLSPILVNVSDMLVDFLKAPGLMAMFANGFVDGLRDIAFGLMDLGIKIPNVLVGIPTLLWDIFGPDGVAIHSIDVFIDYAIISFGKLKTELGKALVSIGKDLQANGNFLTSGLGAALVTAGGAMSSLTAPINKFGRAEDPRQIAFNNSSTELGRVADKLSGDFNKMTSTTFWDAGIGKVIKDALYNENAHNDDLFRRVRESIDANVEARGASLELTTKEKKVKDTPLGYALGGQGVRADFTTMRLAATNVQTVKDEITHELLRIIAGKGSIGAAY